MAVLLPTGNWPPSPPRSPVSSTVSLRRRRSPPPPSSRRPQRRRCFTSPVPVWAGGAPDRERDHGRRCGGAPRGTGIHRGGVSDTPRPGVRPLARPASADLGPAPGSRGRGPLPLSGAPKDKAGGQFLEPRPPLPSTVTPPRPESDRGAEPGTLADVA